MSTSSTPSSCMAVELLASTVFQRRGTGSHGPKGGGGVTDLKPKLKLKSLNNPYLLGVSNAEGNIKTRTRTELGPSVA